jgi:hypothetical protein
MNSSIKHSRQINHFEGAENQTSFASKPSKPVPLRHVIAFNQVRLSFCLDQQFGRDYIAVRMPFIGK